MSRISVAILASLLVLHPLVRVCAQVGSVAAVVRDIRSDLDLRDGHLIGPAAVKLQDVTSHACYVFLGEDHGIAEVPEFADALLSDLVPSGTNTLALEVSPSIAKQLSLELAASNPKQTFALFLRHHPGTVPFYNTIEEFEFLRDAKARIGASFNLIGFDQEFFGASKFLLEQVGDQGLSDDLWEELDALKKEARDKDARAEHSGKYEDLFLLSANAVKLQAFADRLKSRGFNSLPVNDLLASRRIYDIFPQDNYRSNELRDLLMKRNFVRMHGTAPPCGILFKAGSNHGFRGIGPLHTRELGNFVAESADATSNGGVHILIVVGKANHYSSKRWAPR